jgi:hypothetical protein
MKDSHWIHLCIDMQRMFAEDTPWHCYLRQMSYFGRATGRKSPSDYHALKISTSAGSYCCSVTAGKPVPLMETGL